MVSKKPTALEVFKPDIFLQEVSAKVDLKSSAKEKSFQEKFEPVRLAETNESNFQPRFSEWIPDSLQNHSGIEVDVFPEIELAEPADKVFSSEAVDSAKTDTSAAMEIGRVDNPPMKISGGAPVYPRWARSESASGTVTLRFVVAANGKVSNIQVKKIEGDKRFADAAIRAVKKWRFKPALHKDRPVAVWGIQKIRFYYKR